MSPTEQAIQHSMLKELKRRGHYAVKIISANRAGVPDIIACINGRFAGIEVKKPGGRVSALQKHHLQEIEKAGGTHIVCYSLKEFKEWLDRVQSHPQAQ